MKENGHRLPDLRELELLAILGKPLPSESLADLFSAVADACSEAESSDAVEVEVVAEGLADAVRALEEARAAAVDEKEKAEAEHAEALGLRDQEHARELAEEAEHRLEVERALDAERARAEKAEADLVEAVRSGHGLDAESAARLRALAEENARLRAAAERGAAFLESRAREEARAEVYSSLSAEISAREAAERGREEAVREAARLREGISRIAAGDPADAHRLVRVLVGREAVRETGTEAAPGYVPTRRERRSRRGG